MTVLTHSPARRLARPSARRRGHARRWSGSRPRASAAPSSCPTCSPPVDHHRAGARPIASASSPPCPPGSAFEPLMTLYLTDATRPEEIDRAVRQRRRARRQALSGRRDHPFGRRRHRPRRASTQRSSACRSSACRCWCTASRPRPAVDVFDREARVHRRSAGAAASSASARSRWCSSTSPRRARWSSCARARARRGRDHHAAASAAQPQRACSPAASGRTTTACRCSSARRDREALRGGGDQRRSALFPRHRQRAARARRQGERLRLRRDVHGARGASSCTPRRSSRPGGWSGWRRSPSHFGADFYGLPRHDGTHHADQGALGAPGEPMSSAAARLVPYRGRRDDRAGVSRRRARA